MKYLERIGRRGSKPFHTVISTTFAMEFAAFEELMLPQLMASGATNFLVIADERMASMSLADGSQLPHQLGRDYVLMSPPVSDGLFHPKIVLQLGRHSGRLFVGSANITASGLAGNAEAVIEIECQDEPSPEREIIRSAWRYLYLLVPEAAGASKDAINWAGDRAPWLVGPDSEPLQHLADGSATAFLIRRTALGIGQQFLELVGDDPVDRLVVVSPYWDEDLATLDGLIDALQPSSTSVLLDPEQHEFPIGTRLTNAFEFRRLPGWLKGRFAHAKLIIASTATHDHVLVGSANCTTAAMGRDGFGGSNAEACIYRRLPLGRVIDALGLAACLNDEPIDPADIKACEPPPPIPLGEIASRRPGAFELNGDILTWLPPSAITIPGVLQLLDRKLSEIGSLAFDVHFDPGTRRIFRLTSEQTERLSFVIVVGDDFISNPAFVTHRSLLLQKRREVASGATAKALAAFDVGTDFGLWMHQAFNELARADLADRQNSRIHAARPGVQKSGSEEHEPPQHLSYDEFMETRSPDRRHVETSHSSLAGSYSESIRGFLNMLVGQPSAATGPNDSPSEDDWMNLGDEDGEEGLDAETRKVEAKVATLPEETGPNNIPVDAGHFERMVETYVSNLATDTQPLWPSDVLRVRFWLMLLLHKARHPQLPKGLETTTTSRGWPRMALRIISSFFCGPRPPVTRLMMAREYTEMPIDFLECWVTVIWTLDAVAASLSASENSTQFLHFVRKARTEVTKILGLTLAELESAAAVELRVALQRSVGNQLGLSVG